MSTMLPFGEVLTRDVPIIGLANMSAANMVFFTNIDIRTKQ